MKRAVVILLHIGYWVMYLLLMLVFFAFFAEQASQQNNVLTIQQLMIQWMMLMLCVSIIPGLIGFYSFYFILFERFLKRKKILLFFAFAAVVGLIAGFAGVGALSLRFNKNMFGGGSDPLVPIFLLLVFIALVNGVIGLVIKGFISWYADIRLKEELSKKNFETELALVKAQLNPHFLFNTINNIDVLIQKDPDKASAYLNQLSEMLRFMLYETKTEQIPLAREIDYIEKYIALQRIRSSNPDYIQFRLEGDPGTKTIPSMLFIPFIENAFKYAENKKLENAVDIGIRIEADKITFTCTNRYRQIQNSPEQGGLGNELIRKRLQLLYPEKHELHISDQNGFYSVTLILN